MSKQARQYNLKGVMTHENTVDMFGSSYSLAAQMFSIDRYFYGMPIVFVNLRE